MYIVFPGASSYNEQKPTSKKGREKNGLEHFHGKCRVDGRQGEKAMDLETVERESKIGLQGESRRTPSPERGG